MRIGATVLLYNEVAYQSYGWGLLRPLGNLQTVVDFLQDYQVDEISIIRPIKQDDSFQCFLQDLNKVKRLRTLTPLSFGGGIRHEVLFDHFTDIPFERFILTTAFLEFNSAVLSFLKDTYGKQSIICLLPVLVDAGELKIVSPRTLEKIILHSELVSFIEHYANEIVLYDIKGDGYEDAFNFDIVNFCPFSNDRVILSGGIGPEIYLKAANEELACISIENRVLHDEYSIQKKYRRI